MKLPVSNKKIIENEFIDYVPTRMYISVTNKESRFRRDMSFHLDQIDFHYRHYLASGMFSKTLRRVFWEIRRPHVQMCRGVEFTIKLCELLDTEIFKPIERVLLHNEMYEIMSRHKSAKEKIVALSNKLLTPTPKTEKI